MEDSKKKFFCNQCGHEVSPRAYFCPSCGEPGDYASAWREIVSYIICPIIIIVSFLRIIYFYFLEKPISDYIFFKSLEESSSDHIFFKSLVLILLCIIASRRH